MFELRWIETRMAKKFPVSVWTTVVSCKESCLCWSVSYATALFFFFWLVASYCAKDLSTCAWFITRKLSVVFFQGELLPQMCHPHATPIDAPPQHWQTIRPTLCMCVHLLKPNRASFKARSVSQDKYTPLGISKKCMSVLSLFCQQVLWI